MTTDGFLRISDADRTAAADRLAQHYADGRLDRVEFDERLERALAAKTVADLDGLFTGLPGAPAPVTRAPAGRTPTELRVRRGPRSHRVRWLLLVVLVTAAVGHELARGYALWPLAVLAAVLWVRHRHHRRL